MMRERIEGGIEVGVTMGKDVREYKPKPGDIKLTVIDRKDPERRATIYAPPGELTPFALVSFPMEVFDKKKFEWVEEVVE